MGGNQAHYDTRFPGCKTTAARTLFLKLDCDRPQFGGPDPMPLQCEPMLMSTLAALSFSDPIMLLGIAAGLIPIALHLRQRIRAPIVAFPTLRFLKLTVMKTARRRQIQEYFLLFLRVVLFALLAMALARPFIGGGSIVLAYGMVILLLLGAGLLLLAIIYGAALFSKREPAAPTPATLSPDSGSLQPATPPAQSTRKRSSLFSFLFLLLGLSLLIYAVSGLASDRYFDARSGHYSGRSTACVIILDNSHSMLARQDSQSRWQTALAQVRGLLADPLTPAEVAILPTNLPPNGWSEHLTTDTTSVLGSIETLTVSGTARPMPGLVAEAVKLLEGSPQENKMLVIVSDLAGPSANSPELFTALQAAKLEFRNFQLVLMPQALGEAGGGGTPNDVGIMRCTIVGGSTGVGGGGGEMLLEAELINNGDSAVVRDVELLRDGVLLPGQSWRSQIGPAGHGTGRAALKISYHVVSSGLQHLTLRLKDSADALAWDDQRDLLIQVPEPPPVLVLGPTAGFPPVRSAANYVWTALAPYRPSTDPKGGKPAGPESLGKNVLWGGIDKLQTEALDRYAAIFICDVPEITPAQAERLARYVASGHRLIWILGPGIHADTYNSRLGGGETTGLLPNKLAAPFTNPKGSIVDWVDEQAPLWRDLFDTQDPYHSMVVTGRWGLQDNRPARGEIIAKLADGSPLLIRQVTGGGGGTAGSKGEIYTLLTTPGPVWSTLGTTVPFVPMIQRMALGDPGLQNGPGAYEPGQRVRLPLGIQPKGISVDVKLPSGGTLNVPHPPTTTANPPWEFSATTETGLYHWRTSNNRESGEFVVNPPGVEADLPPMDTDLLTHTATTAAPTIRPPLVATTVENLLNQLSERAAGQSLLPGVLALVLVLLLAEALMGNMNPPTTRKG